MNRAMILFHNAYTPSLDQNRLVKATSKSLLSGTAFVLLGTLPTLAQESPISESDGYLGELVLSGDLIAQRGLTTGTSYEILNEDDLQNRPGVSSTQDVLEKAANVTMPVGTAKAASIRGIDGTGPAENANAFFAGSRPRLSYSIDGRPANFNELVYGDLPFWDVNKVELLRGPQSTIAGRNAIAGALVVNTNDPAFEHEQAAQLEFGSNNYKRVSGTINVPLGDKVALRVTGDWMEKTSTLNYEAYEGVEDPGAIESANVRAKLLTKLDIADGATLMFTAAHSRYKGPQAEIITRDFDDQTSNYPEQPVHEETTDSLGVEFDVDLNSAWRFEFNASYADTKFIRTTAVGGSNGRIDGTEIAVDPRFNYSGPSGIEAAFGLHYFYKTQEEYLEFSVFDLDFDDSRETYAAYGEVLIPLIANVDLSLGARYEVETQVRTGGDSLGIIADIDADTEYEVFLPRLQLNWQPTWAQSYGILISKGYNAGGGGIATGSPNPFPIVHYEYEMETVWNYELYGRQELLDGRLALTQNLFYARYSDMQLPYDLTPDDTTDELFIVVNADDVLTYGAEIGAIFDATDTLSLFGSIGLLKTEIVSFPGSGVEGNELYNSPTFSANIGANWAYKDWTAGVSARYSNGYYTGINNRARGKTDPHMIADAKIGYNFGKFDVFAEVTNLFDNDSAVAFYPGETEDLDTAVLEQPRAFRIGVIAKF